MTFLAVICDACHANGRPSSIVIWSSKGDLDDAAKYVATFPCGECGSARRVARVRVEEVAEKQLDLFEAQAPRAGGGAEGGGR